MSVIAEAVRAGCAASMEKGSFCPYPDCTCDDYSDVRLMLETAARHAAEAATKAERERCARIVEASLAEIADNIVQNIEEPVEPSPASNDRLGQAVAWLASCAAQIRIPTEEPKT